MNIKEDRDLSFEFFTGVDLQGPESPHPLA